MSSLFVALEDPINAFLGKSEDKSDNDVSSNSESDRNDDNKAEGSIVHHHSLLWRRSKEESFSDWTIVLIAHNDHEQKDDDNQESSADRSTKRQKTDTQTTFHVHRCILSSVSLYFKSQFSAQVETVEQRNSTSTIHLHQKALEAFPVFLDYLYNPYEGKLGFCVENAVALRHLAMYFGVDILLKDITNIIVTDIRRENSRNIVFDVANIFHDDKLLEAVKIQNTRQESLIAVAPVVYKAIESAKIKKEAVDGDVMSAWKHIMANLDYDHDAFFAANNANHFTCMSATGAGYPHANGIYKLVGTFSEVGEYSNGICMLYKGHDGQWYISICYMNKNRNWVSVGMYSCISNSNYPPSNGWKTLGDHSSSDTCPTFAILPN